MIKLNRALGICNFSPMQERDIINSVPQELMDRLTGKELALVMQALNAHWHKAQAAKEQAIIDEGCIWSEQHGKLLDLSYKKEDGTIQVL